MADAFERRAVVGQVVFGQRADADPRASEPPQQARVQVQRDTGAVRRFRQQQLFVRVARRSLSRCRATAPRADP